MKRRAVILFILFISILWIISCSELIAQSWKAVYYTPKVDSVYYDIQQDELYNDKIIIDFPDGIDYSDQIYRDFSRKGLQLLQYGNLSFTVNPRISNEYEGYFYLKEFLHPIHCRKDTTILKLSFYQKNIKNYSIYIHPVGADIWLQKDLQCKFEGFQSPLQLQLNELFEEQELNFTIPEIDKLLIVVYPDIQEKDVVFASNQLAIFDLYYTEEKYYHPFLDRLFSLPESDSIFKDGTDNVAIMRNTYYYTPWSSFYFVNDKNDEDEIDLVKDVIRQSLEEYQFYSERGLDKQEVLEKLHQLYDVKELYADKQSFLEALSLLLRKEINDGHFFINSPHTKQKSSYSPVRLYEIANKIVVSAVFDSTYMEILPLGSEVVAINGRELEPIIDSLKIWQYGVEGRKRSRAIASLLDRQKGDSVILSVRKEGDNELQRIPLIYNNSITIPANFRIPHTHFEVDKEIGYFKVNRMDGEVFLHYVNNLEKIRDCKGLIIDLRGNGGGDGDGELIFSSFISKPMVYSHIGFKGNHYRKESVVIKPHSSIRLPSKFPVVILGDENTACASEAFIEAMRQLDNCYYLSHTFTSGSLHGRYTVFFPSGIFISLDCLSEKIYSPRGELLECKGIKPDIWIQHKKVEDLIPYNDLLKEEAKKLINTICVF